MTRAGPMRQGGPTLFSTFSDVDLLAPATGSVWFVSRSGPPFWSDRLTGE